MDFLSVAVGYISKAFVESKKAKSFKDDFIDAFIEWIRPIFLKSDPKLVEALEVDAEDTKTQGRLETRLEDLLKEESFQKQLEEWMKKPGGEKLREKNTFTSVEMTGKSLRVGDKESDGVDYERKNIVSIKKGDFEEDITIGDGH